jgi:hypothetical protein
MEIKPPPLHLFNLQPPSIAALVNSRRIPPTPLPNELLPTRTVVFSNKETRQAVPHQLKEDNDRVIKKITDHFDKSLDDRAVGGEGYGLTKTVLDKIDLLIQQTSREYTERIANATENVTDDNSVSFNIDHELDEDDAVFTMEEDVVLHERAVTVSRKERAKQLLEQRKNNGVLVGLVNGRFNPLVQSWRYPKMNLQQMVTLWLMGVPNEHVPPMRRLSPQDVSHFDRGSRDLNRMKNCMLIIQELAELRGVWEPANIKNFWNGATVTRLWDNIVGDIVPVLKAITERDAKRDSSKSRGLALAWRTNADKLIKAKGLGSLFHDVS